MLKVGIKAPEFSLPDQNGVIHSLNDYKGKKVLLYFYPKDNTSGCSKQAASYSDLVEDFSLENVTIIGVSKDSITSHKKFESNYDLKFTILSDVELETIQAYDVWKEKKLYGKSFMGVVRTTYLIDENGIIVFANDKVKASEDAINMSCMLKGIGSRRRENGR